MGAKKETRYLERYKGGGWGVIFPVPRAARGVIGRAKLKRSLQTDSLEEANRRKGSVVADFQAQVDAALGKTPDLEGAALRLRVRRSSASDDDDKPDGRGYSPRDLAELEIEQEVEALAGLPVGVDHHGLPAYEPSKLVKAKRFNDIARSRVTPLRLPEVDFRAQKGTGWQGKTWGKYDRIMGLLVPWLQDKRGGATVEGVDRRTAGAFIGETLREQGWTPQTLNGYLSCLQQYWGWMVDRGLAGDNPWLGQRVKPPKRTQENKERAFTKDEIRKLMGGDPVPYLGDLMRLAALTGARLGALVELRVRDCQDGVFLMPPQKSETGARRVPIHSDLAALVTRRCEGKAGDDWLFPEVPPVRPDESASKVRGDKAGKAYRRYAKTLGVVDKVPGTRRDRINFHSFRRWFITEAQEALTAGASGYTETTISEVVGHKLQGMTMGVYKSAASDAQRRACVEAVRLP